MTEKCPKCGLVMVVKHEIPIINPKLDAFYLKRFLYQCPSCMNIKVRSPK